MSKLDLLAFGAHPDDVEIGMAGTIALYAKQGFKIGICNLTRAELSSNGTPAIRQEEAERAAAILGVSERYQLDLPDRGLSFYTSDQLREVVSLIRRTKPRLVFAPYPIDRHPDHGMAKTLIQEALFNSGIRNYKCAEGHLAHKVEEFHLYMINAYVKPDFIIDVSSVIKEKQEALSAYRSQFEKGTDSVDTPLTNGYITRVAAREQLYGSEAGVEYAEGFKTTKPLLVKQLLDG
ncbi:BshB1 N-aceytl hydrolase for bacillithiol synthesis [Alkalihalophilus pseudofirmus OF4]|uniref:BshB1 N-aceytl hydrolase for bacillithiol synthesis n=1 Tax=Alkalihalophilus pseudofirmus (strain ATCC BAA-2126 / JCM 17055 / OF4) TaxID=398511 RepID=D3G0K2_ALKPO|nr:bacillithiol biosynthesis deacetylase BshB1 [Alkalihalophilus pseudofirmus]ADC51164.1 BshB1 N-aceytl hydrolase for bacillithiol synthesis [Alkalihalophilus pseudofirmus OF4]OLS37977.1 bacillithiol biosynthesis deacetylase BshB1 [Alkalihalophilus pseudofirmus]WEG18374.1 bacillithiol biosynthesis deacetylase BshB1 [Alkalihalophilus pseudofirmus]